ncbi:hypothetical protein BDV33DRAFT_166625 [Aspergillus novoparasiticus]|uniref:Uncharacterized protein n=1 Tax=Aspergillus novoparasiticus TaxID=986946 RepID=A0A5N6F4T6_9EURO|nr:hypothetical protein BDV33DRAFT_166625 [Aspergillus novoparasiticus]
MILMLDLLLRFAIRLVLLLIFLGFCFGFYASNYASFIMTPPRSYYFFGLLTCFLLLLSVSFTFPGT